MAAALFVYTISLFILFLCFCNQYFYQGLNIMFSGAALEGHQLY